MSVETTPVKVSFTFFPADVIALNQRIDVLKKAGVRVRGGTLLRALIYFTPPAGMLAQALQLFGLYAKKTGPREDEPVSGVRTVDLPQDQIDKLDGVITALAAVGVTTTRTFIVRAILRASPADKTLADPVRKFLGKFPLKPSGWTGRKAREQGG